jgi:hypothetical protein
MVARKIVFVVAVVITVVSFCRMFCVTKDHLSAPFDLTFESPNLCTIQSIQKGKNIYDPAMYEDLPFILTIYTPAYHYLVASLPQHPTNRFFTGRIVAMVFMILASLCLFFPYKPQEKIVFSILAIGCFFLIHEIISHTAFLRNDSMALFFSAAAVICAERARKKPGQIVLVSILACLAFTSKQSFLAAPASCFLFFLINHRKDALIFGLAYLLLFATFSIFAHLHWGHGFWFSVFVAPRNPFVWENFVANWLGMLHQPFFVFLLLLITASVIHCSFLKKSKMTIDSPYLAYFLLSSLILVITLGKEGGNVNYFFEPILASLLWLVFLIKKSYARARSSVVLIVIGLLGISVALEFVLTKRSDYSFTTQEKTSRMVTQIDQVKGEIRALQPDNRKTLNLVWAGYTFEMQEDPIMNDLFLYSILWNTNVLSGKPLMKHIIAQHFDLIVLRKDQCLKTTLATPYDYLIGTVLACYELAKVGQYCYFTPRHIS